jgi:hypothetical protein
MVVRCVKQCADEGWWTTWLFQKYKSTLSSIFFVCMKKDYQNRRVARNLLIILCRVLHATRDQDHELAFEIFRDFVRLEIESVLLPCKGL